MSMPALEEGDQILLHEDGKLNADGSIENIRADVKRILDSKEDSLEINKYKDAIVTLDWNGGEDQRSVLEELYKAIAQLVMSSDTVNIDNDILQSIFLPVLDKTVDGKIPTRSTTAVVCTSLVVALKAGERDTVIPPKSIQRTLEILSDTVSAVRGSKGLGIVNPKDVPDGCTISVLLRSLFHACLTSSGGESITSGLLKQFMGIIKQMIDILKAKKALDEISQLWATRLLVLISLECNLEVAFKGGTKVVKKLVKGGMNPTICDIAAQLVDYLETPKRLPKLKPYEPPKEECHFIIGASEDQEEVDLLKTTFTSNNIKASTIDGKLSTLDLEQNLRNSSAAIIVLSRQSKAAVYIWLTVMYANELGIPVSCVLKEVDVPSEWIRHLYNQSCREADGQLIVDYVAPANYIELVSRDKSPLTEEHIELGDGVDDLCGECEDIKDIGTKVEVDTTVSTEISDEVSKMQTILPAENGDEVSNIETLEDKLAKLATEIIRKDDLDSLVEAAIKKATEGYEERLNATENRCETLALELKASQRELFLLRERLASGEYGSPTREHESPTPTASNARSSPSAQVSSVNPKELSARSQMAAVMKGANPFANGMPKLRKSPIAEVSLEPSADDSTDPNRRSQLHPVFGDTSGDEANDN